MPKTSTLVSECHHTGRLIALLIDVCVRADGVCVHPERLRRLLCQVLYNSAATDELSVCIRRLYRLNRKENKISKNKKI